MVYGVATNMVEEANCTVGADFYIYIYIMDWICIESCRLVQIGWLHELL